MTQEEKAKAYDEALERAKAYHRNELSGTRKEITEYIFPELAESEDEEIYREIYFIVHHSYQERIDNLVSPKRKKELLDKWGKVKAWLEKQKEPTPADGWDYADKRMSHPLYLEGFEAGRAVEQELSEFEKQKEQKPEYPLTPDECIKPAEWSEEDEKNITHIIRILDDCYAYGKHDLSKTDHENLVGTLKSLRPSWKPSEEQITALWNLKDLQTVKNSGWYEPLNSLYEQLKKL